jgi:hypothetical protein
VASVIRVSTFHKDFDTKEDAILFPHSSAPLRGAPASWKERRSLIAGTHGQTGSHECADDRISSALSNEIRNLDDSDKKCDPAGHIPSVSFAF